MIAIVYVLSRTGDRDALVTPSARQNNLRMDSAAFSANNSSQTIQTVGGYSSLTASPSQNCPVCHENPSEILAELRQEALAKSPPHIIECAAAEAGASQDACHLPAATRYQSLGQKGATLWCVVKLL